MNPFLINVGFIVKAEPGFNRVFDLDVDQVFLPPDLQLNDLRGSARFSRTPQGLLAEVMTSARTPGECARCLDPIEQPIAAQFTELYAFDERSTSQSHLILPANHQVDLAPLIREYMILDMPITPLCKPECAGLCPVCGINRNQETCEHETTSIDPRLADLKNLLDKDE